MEYEVDVNVTYKNKDEDEVKVFIDTDEFIELEDSDDKISYIKTKTKESYDNIKKIHFDTEDLEELEKEIDDIYDTSILHPNEDFDEFMEHEDFD